MSFSSDLFQVHHERMRQMMRGFSDPFGQGFMPSITDRGAGQPNTNRNTRTGHVSVNLFSILQPVVLFIIVDPINPRMAFRCG